ncbi:MAG: FecR family protein [bacterium]|nr:hypothetical protein [Gammaproteobacteria bacterium]HIL97655.1 hypothetical protein [Pseudomonadales bacterium]
MLVKSQVNIFRFSFFLICSVALTACTTTQVQKNTTPTTIGVVTASTGYPKVIRKSSTYILASQAKIYQGDIIETDATSKVLIQMTDETSFSLGPNSHFVLHTYDYSPKKNTAIVKMSFTSGSLRTKTSNLAEPRKRTFEIKTPLAVISVLAADFWSGYLFGENQNTLDVAMITGAGIIATNDHGSVGIVEQGYGTTVIGRSALQTAKRWSRQKTRRALSNTTL